MAELCSACGRDLKRALALIEAGAKLLRATLSDPVSDWIAAECDLGNEAGRMRSAYLYAAFIAWLDEEGISSADWSMTRFGRRLGEKGFASTKDRRGNKVRVGIVARAARANLDKLEQGATVRSSGRPAKPARGISLPFDGLYSTQLGSAVR